MVPSSTSLQHQTKHDSTNYIQTCLEVIIMDSQNYPTSQTTNMVQLDSMSFQDLETMKEHLDAVRRRILQLQNAQSLLFRLPGEIRNKIFLFAMHAELEHRKETSRHNHSTLYTEPAFFRTSKQIFSECFGVWFKDLLVWEEFCTDSKQWKRLEMAEVKELCSMDAKCRIVTKMAHCDLGRTRESVEESRSICPRKGLVRAQTEGVVLPQLRWWIW